MLQWVAKRVDLQRQWQLGVSRWLWGLRERVRKLELEVRASRPDLLTEAEAFARRAKIGAPVTRDQAAAFLAVDGKQVVRWEAKGRIRRLPGYGMHVRFASGDVLKLASAQGKEN